MINKKFYIICALILNLISFNAYSIEQFNFDVTEIQITENGNKFIGLNRGKIKTDDGIIIDANQFEYDKTLNILNANGDVRITDNVNDYIIKTQNITYIKDKDLILTKDKSNATSLNDNITISASDFTYDRQKKIIVADKNVQINNKFENYEIFSEKITYLISKEIIYTKGKTTAKIHSKYDFLSEDVTFLKNSMILTSENKTTITDKSNLYNLSKFVYSINNEELKGEEIIISSNYKLPTSDTFYFSSAVINLKNRIFLSKDIELKVHKGIFGNENNDPRIKGISATGDDDKTIINKGIFTSCKKDDNCPPWSISAKKIIHDKNKKEIFYENAVLNIYDLPVLYFPKFFHPDPSVKRRSGLLMPQFNNSNALGSSYAIPYFHVLAENKDFTITPYIFENSFQMFQNEYRVQNKNSNLITNFGYVNNYKSSIENNKNSIFNIFASYDLDLKLQDFISSDLFLNIEKVTNDTFLKVFETNIQNNSLKPDDNNNLKSEIKLSLKHENFNFEGGAKSFENLNKISSDRYEYILPYYFFDKNLNDDFFGGNLSLVSSGENILNNTNQLKSTITNDLNFSSSKYINDFGFSNNLEVDIKNLNSLGKNHSNYKSSPQIEFMSLISFNSSLPLQKKDSIYNNYLTPKISLKINPSDMKNYASEDKKINTYNIFNNNRLGINDSLEAGRSITIGLDFRKEKVKDINKYFELKLATVLRDKEDNFIPKKSTLNRKHSNLFGSVSTNFSKFGNVNYNFALDNDFSSFEYNDFNAELILANLITKFNFVEENGEMGNSNYLETGITYNIDDNNFLNFNTRRNRKLNLTEYYDLVYEYKNDCLVAGIKYKKTYYEDRDLKPAENLFFTLSIIPITSYEQKIDR